MRFKLTFQRELSLGLNGAVDVVCQAVVHTGVFLGEIEDPQTAPAEHLKPTPAVRKRKKECCQYAPFRKLNVYLAQH